MAELRVYRPRAASPWASLDQLRREMNSLFDRGVERGGTAGVFPPVNLYETPDAYVLTAEIPGVAPEEIQVSLEGSTLSIQGERRIDSNEYRDASLHRRERQAGRFRRAFSLPAKVESEKVEAVQKNGVLMLRVPKSPEAKPRQITVQTA